MNQSRNATDKIEAVRTSCAGPTFVSHSVMGSRPGLSARRIKKWSYLP